ncbi:MAG: hypothetical protein ACR2PG_16280 [Hyphomicrobiaceae bacterium]
MSVFDLVSIKSLSERLEKSSSWYAAALRAKRRLTSQITGDTREEKIESLCRKFDLLGQGKKEVTATLVGMIETKEGQQFFDDKIDEINRESFHKGILLVNATLQLLAVDLLSLGFWPKAVLVTFNVGLALYAQRHLLIAKNELLAGPIKVPSKPAGPMPNLDRWNVWRWIVGSKSKEQLNAELSYTQQQLDYFEARDKRDLPYKAAARRELVYATAYAVNAFTLVLGAAPITHYLVDLPILDDTITFVINCVAALGNAAAGVSSLIISGSLNAGASQSHLRT